MSDQDQTAPEAITDLCPSCNARTLFIGYSVDLAAARERIVALESWGRQARNWLKRVETFHQGRHYSELAEVVAIDIPAVLDAGNTLGLGPAKESP